MLKLKHFFLLLGIVIAISSCTNLQAVYNEQAYQQAVSLKVESLALMEKATTPYENHENEIIDLKQELNKAYEYANGRPNNKETASQWQLLKDPDRNLLGGFLHRWEQEETLSAGFIEEAKDLVGDAFTKIIELESGKRKS